MAAISTKLGRFFAIRKKGTDLFLPTLKRPVRGGYTHTEPYDINTLEGTPRLFTTERGAKNALFWWARGELTVRITAGDFGSLEPEPSEDWQNTPVESRKRDDMEVIEVHLSTERKV